MDVKQKSNGNLTNVNLMKVKWKFVDGHQMRRPVTTMVNDCDGRSRNAYELHNNGGHSVVTRGIATMVDVALLLTTL
jgi:hypothetical protein